MTPCSNCPFVVAVSFPLKRARAQEIADALRSDGDFPCHKTTRFDDEGEHLRGRPDAERFCRGALAVMENDPSVLGGALANRAARMRVVFFNDFETTKLEKRADCFPAFEAFVDSMAP